MLKKIFNKSNFLYLFSLVNILIITSQNFLIQGITCNDEVQLRLFSQNGILYFLKKQILDDNIRQGRVLASFFNFKIFSYVSENMYVYRLFEIIVILSSIILLGYFIYKISLNHKLGILTSILALIFLPITFEHSVPNAFVIVVCQPLILLLISFICYLSYLDGKKKKDLILCCFFFFWGCCLYEFVITYIIAYPLMFILKRYSEKKITLNNCIETLKFNIPIFLTGIGYFILYILLGKIFQTTYEGTKLSLVSFGKIFNVIRVEWLSSLPGYYLINSKYRYLYNLYSNNIKNDILILALLLIFTISLVILLSKLISNNKVNNNSKKKSFFIIIILLIYTILPVLPNSISELYQNAVSENFFTSIPVSLFIYFAMISLISYVIYEFCSKYNVAKILSLVLIIIISIKIQVFNFTFAKEQNKDYERFTMIENFLSNSYWKNVSISEINAPSLYVQKNNLSIENNHWTNYLKTKGVNIAISNSNEESDYFLEMQDDGLFYFHSSEYDFIASPNEIKNKYFIRNSDEVVNIYNILNAFWKDGNYTFYYISLIDDFNIKY